MSDRLDLAVLMGGGTREHEISLATGAAVADALRESGTACGGSNSRRRMSV